MLPHSQQTGWVLPPGEPLPRPIHRLPQVSAHLLSCFVVLSIIFWLTLVEHGWAEPATVCQGLYRFVQGLFQVRFLVTNSIASRLFDPLETNRTSCDASSCVPMITKSEEPANMVNFRQDRHDALSRLSAHQFNGLCSGIQQ